MSETFTRLNIEEHKLLKEAVKIANKAIKLKNVKLNALLEITIAINNNFSRDQLFKIYEFALKNQLKVGRLILFTNNNSNWKSILCYDSIDRTFNIDVGKELVPVKEITEVNKLDIPSIDLFDYIIPVYHKNKPLAYLLVGDISKDAVEDPQSMHIPFIQTITNIITVAIENKSLYKENIRRERIKKELEMASEMQSMLIPKILPQNSKYEFSAIYQPHQEVGGDYYDFIRLNEEEIVFCMADVSGKGISAAILMANFQASLRALFTYRNVSLKEIIIDLNAKVNANAKGEKFITLFLAKYNIKTQKLEYVNAGHNPPIVTDGKEITFLKKGCPGLGMFEVLPMIESETVDMGQGAILLCYTDGAVELNNDEEMEFGTAKLVHLLHINYNKKPIEIVELISDSLERYRGQQPYIDDVALLACKFY